MELALSASLIVFALVSGAAVPAFQNPARGTVALLVSAASTAGAVGLAAGTLAASAVIWLASTGALLLLYLVLLLNLTAEERGARRLSLRRFGALIISTFALSGVLAILLHQAAGAPAARPAARVLDPRALAEALAGPLGALVVVAIAALGLAVLAALLIARRQP